MDHVSVEMADTPKKKLKNCLILNKKRQYNLCSGKNQKAQFLRYFFFENNDFQSIVDINEDICKGDHCIEDWFVYM